MLFLKSNVTNRVGAKKIAKTKKVCCIGVGKDLEDKTVVVERYFRFSPQGLLVLLLSATMTMCNPSISFLFHFTCITIKKKKKKVKEKNAKTVHPLTVKF